ncbi:hypothetical protein BN871_BA_00070 [Paenibacillus sp. P22]|nr:hypothetical protein BN871_BA_00070 [Paenibacillus sp. P22]
MERGENVNLRAYKEEDARAIVDAHAELYGREHGYDESFREIVDERVRGIVERSDSRERFWILESDGRHLGSICIKLELRHPPSGPAGAVCPESAGYHESV